MNLKLITSLSAYKIKLMIVKQAVPGLINIYIESTRLTVIEFEKKIYKRPLFNKNFQKTLSILVNLLLFYIINIFIIYFVLRSGVFAMKFNLNRSFTSIECIDIYMF